MEEGFTDRVRKAALTAENLVSEAENLAERSNVLSAEEKTALPKFKGLWKEKEIRKYLDRLEEALKKPRVYRSRKLLEEVGITSDNISSDVLESTEEIRKLVMRLREVKEIPNLLKILGDTKSLPHWLNDDMDTTAEMVDAIVEAKEAFRRLMELDNLDDKLKNVLTIKGFEDPSSIQNAEELDSRIATLRGYDIDCQTTEENLPLVQDLCFQIYDIISELENLYKVLVKDIGASVRGKPLAEAKKSILNKLEGTRRQYANLEKQWLGLSRTLQSLGYEIPSQPQGIIDIQESILELENRCRDSLGESGQKLLKFFVGDSEYPEDLSSEDIKKALEMLRPFIVKGLGGTEWPE